MVTHSSYPTFGKPTMPHLSDVPNRPSNGPGPSDSDEVLFFGGMVPLLPLTCATRNSCLLRPRCQDLESNNLLSVRTCSRIFPEKLYTIHRAGTNRQRNTWVDHVIQMDTPPAHWVAMAVIWILINRTFYSDKQKENRAVIVPRGYL